MNLQRRLKVLGERVAERAPHVEASASSQWLMVLKVMRPWFERQPSSPERDAVMRRIDDSIALLEEAGNLVWAHLEYFCRACVLRLSYSTPEWKGRELAVMEEDYEGYMREIAGIERPPLGPRR